MTHERTGLVPPDVAAWQAKRRVAAPHILYTNLSFSGIAFEPGHHPRGHRVRHGARDVQGDRWELWAEMVQLVEREAA